MPAPGMLYPQRAAADTISYVSLWTIGATGAHTRVYGRGFSGVARTAAGKYTITFTEVPEGPLVDLKLTLWKAADEEPKILAPTLASYDAVAKTVKYEAWDIDETAAQVELISGGKVAITATWLRTA